VRRIVSHPRVLGGKPVIEGTRISVEQVLGLLANGMSVEAICSSFPILAPEDVRGALSWAQAALRNDVVIDLAASWPVPLPALLADMNVAVEVVASLRAVGVDVASVYERALGAATDDEILALAASERRFVLTHDADFGRLAILEGALVHGVLYLRPGDRPPDAVIAELRALLSADIDWTPPVVAVLRGGRLRLRRLA
jgi:uncharacterized protein (DUF433 family)/predicted nuclease of predicted toxin-antitoxin system